MMNFMKENKIILLVAVLVLSFVWAGKKMKEGREAQKQALAQKVQSQSPSPSKDQAKVGSASAQPTLDPNGLKIISESFDKNGYRTVELSDKTKEQLAKERQAFEIAKMQAVRDASARERRVAQEVNTLLKTKMKPADVKEKIESIAMKKAVTDNEKANSYADLRNQIFMSATPEAEKSKMIDQIDAKISALNPQPFAGYVSTDQPDGSVLLTPK